MITLYSFGSFVSASHRESGWMTDSDIPEFFLDIFSVRALFKHDGIGLSEHKNSFIDWWMVNTWLLFSPKLERRRENLYVHFLPHLINKKING